MCGIAALFIHPEVRSKAVWQEIWENFTRNLVANEVRGPQATGVAIVEQGGGLRVLKRPIPAREFVRLEEYQSISKTMGSKTSLIMGHTRMPTKGSPNLEKNNHPLLVGRVLGVHNGHIMNDDELFKKQGLTRQAQVDSEVIFRLLEKAASKEEQRSLHLHTTRPLLRLLKGQFTILACHLDAPHQLLALKHENPLCVHYESAWKGLVFSSRYLFLRQVFGRSVLTEALPHDQLLIFDNEQFGWRRHNPSSQLSFRDS